MSFWEIQLQKDEWEYESVSQNQAPHKIFIIKSQKLCVEGK